MGNLKRAIDYVGKPATMLLELVDIAEARGNDRLRRMWQRQYLRMTDERGARL
jgi:hypothetical protein